MHKSTATHAVLLLMTLALAAISSVAIAATQQASTPGIWEQTLKQHYFAQSPITENSGVITLDAPARAEDPALVPIRIRAAFPQTEQHYIEEITVIIDRNPDPRAGVFTFSPRSGRADLELRLRIDQYSHVRAIARTNNGELHMVSRYVKASGGCSAPSSGDLEQAMARLGKMRLLTKAADEDDSSLLSTQLRISHPNITGMQRNQETQLVYPSHFVRKVRVTLDGEIIFSADVGISISENPSFRFYIKTPPPEALGNEGELIAEVFDSKENRFVTAGKLEPQR